MLPHISKKTGKHWREPLGSIECGLYVTRAQFQTTMTSTFPSHENVASEVDQSDSTKRAASFNVFLIASEDKHISTRVKWPHSELAFQQTSVTEPQVTQSIQKTPGTT